MIFDLRWAKRISISFDKYTQFYNILNHRWSLSIIYHKLITFYIIYGWTFILSYFSAIRDTTDRQMNGIIF